MKNNILARHIIIQNIKIFSIVLAIVYAIVIMVDCAEIVRRCSSLGQEYVISYLLISYNRSFAILSELMPYMYLISAALTMTRMNTTEELTILLTNGYSIRHVNQYFAITGFVFGIMNLVLLHPYATALTRNAVHLERKFFVQHTTKNDPKTHIWIEQKISDQEELLIYIKSIKQNIMDTVFIFTINQKTQFTKRLSARKAEILQNGAWLLYDVTENKKKNSVSTRYKTKNFKTSIRQQDISLYNKSPATLNIFELIASFKMRKKLKLPTFQYEFTIIFVAMKVLLMILVSMIAAITNCRHHRYNAKWFSVLIIISMAFLLNFFMSILKSVGVTYDVSPIILGVMPIGGMLLAAWLIMSKRSNMI